MTVPDDRLAFLEDTWRPPSSGARKGSGAGPVVGALSKLLGGSQTESTKARLARITSRAPEVVVKVSGRQRGAAHTLAHLSYIARHGKLDVETGDGEKIESKARLAELAGEWADDERLTTGRREPLTSVSMVLSMPPGHDANRIYDAARAFARTELERFPFAMALHTDTDHPHVHVTVAARGEGGERFDPRKHDLARWREAFARELRARGIVAEATPRRARGKIHKQERTAVRKVDERAASGRGQRSRVVVGRHADARAAASIRSPTPEAWESAAFARQASDRADYRRAAEILELSDDPADRRLARQTREFVSEMQAPVTRTRSIAIAISTVTRDWPPSADRRRRRSDRDR